MRRTGRYVLGLMGALGILWMLPLTAQAKEERTPVGHISLTIQSDIQAGESGGSVEVTLDEGECSVESVECQTHVSPFPEQR